MDKPTRLKNFNVMATQELSSTVMAYLGQDLSAIETGILPTATGRSPYLAVVLHKKDTNDLIRLKLSTVRRLFKMLDKRDLLKSRRLSFAEKLFNKM